MANPPGTFDPLTTHFIVGTIHLRLEPFIPHFMAAAAYALPYAVGENFDRMQAQIDSTPVTRTKRISAVAEWLCNSKDVGRTQLHP